MDSVFYTLKQDENSNELLRVVMLCKSFTFLMTVSSMQITAHEIERKNYRCRAVKYIQKLTSKSNDFIRRSVSKGKERLSC